ncbi:sensor histidine kinase [Chryseobacterium wanjuense]
MKVLKNQLDPHFLFNSLNVLSSLIDESPKQAQKFTASMSKIYRYVLEQKDKELVTVEDELEFAKTYCDLLKTRFEDSVDFVFDVKKEDYRRFVVPLSLQLLLENCIKHNFATSSKPLIIKIFSENDTLCIENNLQVREQIKESSGIGLANIVQRYSFAYETKCFHRKI